MNASVTFDLEHACAEIEKAKIEKASQLKSELDKIFKSKISTPEEVYSVYEKLCSYAYYAGEQYKITFEENTIV